MTPQQLKNSILQLAIQGKLVEQRPEEGTAEALYREIQAEKARLVNPGKIKKDKPLPEITDDELPFDIPESWKWVRLAELVTIVTGKRDVNFGSPNGKYAFFTCAKKPTRCNSFSFSGESLLLAGNGDISNITYFSGEFEAYQRTYVLQPYIEDAYLFYIYYHLQYNWVQYNSGKIYGTAIPYIRLGNLQHYCVALPPLAEQKRIVARIEELLPLVDRYEQAWTQLQALDQRFPADLQKSILQLAIQGRLVEQRPEEGTAEALYRDIQAEKARLVKEGKIKKDKPLPEIADDELPFDIPENWMWVRLGTLLRVIGGISYDKKDVAKEGFRILRGGNIQNMNVLTAEDDVFLPQQYKEEDKIIRVGDFLIVASTGSKVVIGKAAYVDKLFPDTMIGAFLRICRPFSLSLAGYLRIIFASDFYRKHIRELAQGTNINNVKEAYITQFAIPLPPLAEQKRIVARIEELLPLCEALKHRVS